MIHLKDIEFRRKKNQLILANGSERGDFVNMEYVVNELKRLHDGIQLMKTYYPYDPLWNTKDRISKITQFKEVGYCWDYEYDDYDPLDIFEEKSKTLSEMKQIKEFGSDIHLTLTIDISLPDRELEKIVDKLKDFGRIFLRINHECNGKWFRHNLQYSYRQVIEFFIRFHNIIKANSSQIYTVINFSGDYLNPDVIKDEHLVIDKGLLKEVLSIADYWSIDKYTSLDYGWPFDKIDLTQPGRYWTRPLHEFWRGLEEFYLKLIWANEGRAKKLFISEFNTDALVDGEENQAMNIYNFYNRLNKGDFEWIEGVVLYQFRDYAGLGLETGTLDTFKKNPSFKTYRKSIQNFEYEIHTNPDTLWTRKDFTFSWLNSDLLRGLRVSGISRYTQMINGFEVPIFILQKREAIRIEPGSSFELKENKTDYLDILVPPYFDAKSGMRTTYLLRNALELIKGMLI